MEDERTESPGPKVPEDRESPWVAYLTDTKQPAASFLKKMVEGVVVLNGSTGKKTKQTTPRPLPIDNEVRSQFAEVLAAKPERIDRLVFMLQASISAGDAIRGMVVDLAYCGVKRLIVVTLPDSPKAGGFGAAISTWITSVPDRPSRTETFQILLVALHIGWYHKCLDDDEALGLIVSAFSKPEGRQTVTPAVRPELMLLDVLLAAPASKTTLSRQTLYFQQLKAKADKANATIHAQREHIERLRMDNAELRATVDRMREESVAMEERYATAMDEIAGLGRETVRVRASYQHKLDDTKGRISGVLEGQVARWLQTSLEAVRMTPPRAEVIEERLENTLALIEKELQWLRPLV